MVAVMVAAMVVAMVAITKVMAAMVAGHRLPAMWSA